MNHFIQQHKYYLSIFFILFIVTLISGGYLLATQQTLKHKNIETPDHSATTKLQQLNTPTASPTPSEEGARGQGENTTTLQHSNTKTSSTSEAIEQFEQAKRLNNLNNTTISSCQQNCIDAEIKIGVTSYKLQVTSYTTVYDAMTILQQNSNFSFSGTTYSSLGFFVNEINGIKNDIKNNKFWIYYINDQSAKVGVSNYKLNNNDLIKWEYEESKF